jgi:aminoglycoside/choline kinase family phosphotransferase
MGVHVAPIEKGGSGRKFWRVTTGTGSHILVRYGTERPENRHYVTIADFLTRIGVCVPRIFFHDETEGIILMEDAGTQDLWAFRAAPWMERRALYQRTLDEALLLHTRGLPALPGAGLELQPSFDAALYRWEQDYFFEQCLGRHFGIPAERCADARAELAAVADRLAALPRCLVHRDFQSQNVIIRDGHACLIDFQGLRPGLAQYDLASLLLDPYVALTPAERDELLAHYLSGLRGAGAAIDADWHEVYLLCALQRLMQALGAYGKLGHLDGRTHFLTHIPIALPRLIEVLDRLPGLAALRALVPR